MDQMLFTLPILPGKTAAARAFLQELGGVRKQDLLVLQPSNFDGSFG